MAADLNCELLHVGNQARNMRRGLAGPRFAYRPSVPIRPGDIAARSKNPGQRRAALGERDDPIRPG
jgi:hypothetical protein